MLAAIAGINTKIRSHPVSNYVFSTHFWGPASNFSLPAAALLDTQKSAEIISGRMTSSLLCASAVFMRYALAVRPKNYLLFACHFVNFSVQSVQAYRYTWYWHLGGKERADQLQ